MKQNAGEKIRVLLTVPNVERANSPYREMISIARYLPKDEFDLTICSLRKDGFSETEPLLSEMGVKCFVARFRPRGRRVKNIWSSIRDQKQINSHGPFHVQHSLDFSYSPFEALMARAKSRPYIFSHRSLSKGVYGPLLGVKISLAKRIIAISNSVMEYLSTHGAPSSKLRKILLGIDVEDINAQLQGNISRDDSLLSVGHIIPLKRHEDAIRALAVLGSEREDLCLRIAGSVYDEAYHDELVRLVSDLGLTEKVEFLATRTDVVRLMEKAGVLVHCSETEAFGWVIVEAICAGLPVVASATGGPSEIIQQGVTGFLIPVGDINGYADAIKTVLGKKHLSEQLAENARRVVSQQFSAKTMVEKIAGVYRESIN